ncbi:MAG TPA: NAD(P)/FAD-dependent oxidoreductase, partial [Ktedonobacteraceae bacterium]
QVIGVRGRQVDGKPAMSEILARLTIVANGSSSSIGRALGVDKPDQRHIGVAIRAYLEMSELDHVIEGYLLSEFVPGYAWIFPVNAHVANVGMGTRADILKNKRLSLVQGLHTFLSSPAILSRIPTLDNLSQAKTWMLRYGSQPMPRVYPGAIFVGDAGSFVNPLTGDGIYPAMLTARLAAQVALSSLTSNAVNTAMLTEFERLWKQVLAWPMRRDYFLQRLMEAWPPAADIFIKYWRMRDKNHLKTHSWFGQKLIPF